MRILLTGFSAFQKITQNPSQILVTELAKNLKLPNTQIDFKIFKSSYKYIDENIGKILDESYNLVLMTGLKPKATKIYIEQFAKNLDNSKAKDVDNVVKINSAIEEHNYVTLESNLNINKISSYLKNNILIQLNSKPSAYLCNHLYYKALSYAIRSNLETKMLFIHIPKFSKISLKKQLQLSEKILEGALNQW